MSDNEIDIAPEPEVVAEDDGEELSAKKGGRKGGWTKGRPRSPARTSSASSRTASSPSRTEETRPAVRTRLHRGGQSFDKFAIPKDKIPRGWSYEWKTMTVAGQDNPAYDAFMREQGWEAVPASRHPEMMAPGAKGAIIRDGMILMERPRELTEEARAENAQIAREAVIAKEEQLRAAPKGEFQRHRADGSSTVTINKSVERGGLEID